MGQAELDAAVRLAAQLCAAPMALVAWTEGEGDAARGVPTLQAAAGITLPQLAREFDALRPLLVATDLVVIDGPATHGAGPEAGGFAFLAGAPLRVAGHSAAGGHAGGARPVAAQPRSGAARSAARPRGGAVLDAGRASPRSRPGAACDGRPVDRRCQSQAVRHRDARRAASRDAQRRSLHLAAAEPGRRAGHPQRLRRRGWRRGAARSLRTHGTPGAPRRPARAARRASSSAP